MIRTQRHINSETNRRYWDRVYGREGRAKATGGVLLDALFRLLALDLAARRVLDVGCGTGEMLQYVNETVYASIFPYAEGNYPVELAPPRYAADLQLFGVDCSRAAIAEAVRERGRAGIRFAVMDAERLEFKDGFFQRVLCLDSLGNFGSAQAALEEMARVLAPEGVLVLVAPVVEVGESETGRPVPVGEGPNELTGSEGEWRDLVTAIQGLEVTEMTRPVPGFAALRCRRLIDR